MEEKASETKPSPEQEEASPQVQDSDQNLESLALRLEALLFVSNKPLSARKLASLLDLDSIVPLRQAAEILARCYDGRAFELCERANGYQLATRKDFETDILKLQREKKAQKLTPGALETLAVIAYKQPVTRLEIEAIRGSQSDHYLRILSDRDLIKITGRKKEKASGSGSALYGTTTTFLNSFGIQSLSELPQEEDLNALAESSENNQSENES